MHCIFQQVYVQVWCYSSTTRVFLIESSRRRDGIQLQSTSNPACMLVLLSDTQNLMVMHLNNQNTKNQKHELLLLYHPYYYGDKNILKGHLADHLQGQGDSSG